MTMTAAATTETAPTTSRKWAPCLSCGVAVQHADPESIETFTSYGHQQIEVEMTRCEVCAAIRDSAIQMMRAWPLERGRIGDPSIAVHRLEIALVGLDALGVTDHRVIDRLTATGAEIRRLIEHMSIPGGVARFCSRFMSSLARGERIDSAAPERWAGLDADHRRGLNEAWVHLYVARTEVPGPVLCPSESGRPSGCMLCGVGAVMALPSRAAYQWIEMSADAVTIGGQPRAEDIDGYLCPRCDYAVDRADGIGATAMGLSVIDYIAAGVMNDLAAARGIDGLVAWGALRASTPNAEPWAHVDLSALLASLRTLS